MKFRYLRAAALVACSAGLALVSGQSAAAPKAGSTGAEHARIVAYWTKERVAAAIPRDLRIDERGYGYLRKPNGVARTVRPHHRGSIEARVAAAEGEARWRHDCARDQQSRSGCQGATVGAAYTFKATVTDASGVSSVSFRIGPSGAAQQSFNGIFRRERRL